MLAAVHDILHRRGQNVRVDAAQVGHIAAAASCSLPREPRPLIHPRIALAPSLLLAWRAVNLKHQFVERLLVVWRLPSHFRRDDFINRRHRPQNALAEVARLVAVAHLQRFVLAGRRAAGHNRASQGIVRESDFDFDGRVAA